jgi:2-phospho-L-lactate guanylyltransferase (CobY/MobA/RfbA family)
MLGGILKSLEKVTSKIKWVCPSKAIKKKKQQIKEERQKKSEWREESNCW